MKKLFNAFSFTREDLQANKVDFLTPSQEKKVAGYRKSESCGTFLAILAVVSTGIFFGAYFYFSKDITNSPGFQKALPIYIGTFSVFVLVFAFFLILGKVRSRGINTGKISVAEGEIITWRKDYKHGTVFFLKAGNTKFQLHSLEQFEVMQSYSFCKIYYVKNPPVHIILSVEITG